MAYRGRSARMALAVPARKQVIGYQHPLSVYDELDYAMPSLTPSGRLPVGESEGVNKEEIVA